MKADKDISKQLASWRKRHPVPLREISEATGVSIATISNALRGLRVSEIVLSRIEQGLPDWR